ncbi:cupin domain-containing protein, partial [Rhodococcus sp. NPDC057529]|uniref:cupin domain-containing protein n=1 Tax=Rhodococcus sp. NPDC057529 TaxID=3346158 RepID=UPI0036734B05
MTELPEWARTLDLAPHPEGGWYRETWRSDVTIPEGSLPDDYPGPRSAGTAILFLLMPGQQSAWHSVRSAEIWLFHRGSPLRLELGGNGSEPATPSALILGADVGGGGRKKKPGLPRTTQKTTKKEKKTKT